MALLWPQATEGEFTIHNFRFQSGATLPFVTLHYRTLGTLRKSPSGDTLNAILILHGTTGNGGNFLRPQFAGRLFNPGQLLSHEQYYLILPDNLGHGRSTKPSTSLKNSFPRYGYNDMIRAQHILLTQHLGVNHLRLVTGTSMGGMHTWVWGTTHPDFMDALFPLAALPSQISGRNRMMRKHAIDSIRSSPDFASGEYTSPPSGMVPALHVAAWMSSSPLQWQKLAPDWDSADQFIDDWIQVGLAVQDANDFAYAYDASWDYDPGPLLARIKVPVTAVNFADDQVNPPELGILEEEMKKVEKGKAVVMPISEKTAGHGTHSIAEVWEGELEDLLKRSEKRPGTSPS